MAEGRTKTGPIFLKGHSGIGILLLHGWTSPPDELLPLAKYLNSFGYTVSAPLLQGHGTKPEDLKDVHWQDWLRDSQSALDYLKSKCEIIFVGGISMGADLAVLLSENKGVAGILSLGAPLRFPFHRLAEASLFFTALVKTYRKKYFPPWVKKIAAKHPSYSYYPVGSAKEMIRLSKATEKFLPKVSKPILIMQAKHDHLVSRKSPQIIYTGINSAVKEIYWVEDAYHVFVNDKKVWDKIAEFISRILSL